MPRKVSPSADGFGKYVRGGEDGVVLFINSTSEAASVSAWEATYPRIIIPRVSGYVELTGSIDANYSSRGNFTYIGFFAPGELVYKNYTVRSNSASNFVIRGLKSRFGDRNKEISTSSGDPITFGVFSGNPGPSNFYMDHSVGSWGTDELFSIAQGINGTVQYCMFYEALHRATINEKGTPHGYGHIWGEKNLSFHHNLLAYQDQRMPLLQNTGNSPDGVIDIRNNVMYAWHQKAMEAAPEVVAVNFMRNSLIRKANYTGNSPTAIARFSGTEADNTARIYLQGNKLRHYINGILTDIVPTLTDDPASQRLQLSGTNGTNTANLQNIVGVLSEFALDFGSYEFTETADQSSLKVAALAGTFNRDLVDLRILNDYQTGVIPIQGSVTGIVGLIDAPEDSKHFGAITTGYPTVQPKAQVLDGPTPHYLPSWFTTKYNLNVDFNYTLAGTPITVPQRFIIFGKGPQGIQLSQYVGSIDYDNDLIYNVYRALEFHITGEINELEVEMYTLTVQSTVGGEIRLNNGNYVFSTFDDFTPSEVNLLYARPTTHPNPLLGYRFVRWRQVSNNSTISLVSEFSYLMPSNNVTLEAIFEEYELPVTPPVVEGNFTFFRFASSLFVEYAGGWGDLHPAGQITGGQGGTTHYFNEASTRTSTRDSVTYNGFDAMWTFIGDNPVTPMTIIWTGEDVNLLARNYGTGGNVYPFRIPQNSGPSWTIENKTIMTSAGQKFIGGSFQFQRWKNCIIRNWIRKGDGQGGEEVNYIPHGGNAMSFTTCERLWIDHCELDSEATISGTEQIKDGTIDFGQECDYITISNCYIRRSAKTALISWADDAFADRGKMRITYRNNLWENNHSRQPFARFGKIHLLNNLYRYTPAFTASPTQYPWARIIEVGFESQFYSQGNKYYGHRYSIMDQDSTNPTPLSGLISDNDWFQSNPTFSTFLTGSGQYKAAGSLRPENVNWNPNTQLGYSYPLGLLTPDQAETRALQWAGAKYHLKQQSIII